MRRTGPLSRRAIGRPWVNIVLWAGAAVALSLVAPDLQQVGTTDPEKFLPADAPAAEAQELLDRGWPEESVRDAGVVVVARQDGLTDADRAYLEKLGEWMREEVPEVDAVQSVASDPRLAPFLTSADGEAVLTVVTFSTPPFDTETNEAVSRIRDRLAATAPEGARVHLTGAAGIGADQAQGIRDSFDRTAVGTLVLILLILLYVYRSPVAALIPLATIGTSFVVARSLVALLADTGFEVSSQVETFMVVMVFGAGTDYVLFLLSRYREERQRGGPTPLARTLRLVGEVVVASGATVTLAFLSQLTARFGVYRSMGPAIGIAVAVTVLGALTLTPAIAALAGRYAFWPAHPEDADAEPHDPRWARIAERVTRRPALVLGAGTLLLAIPAVAATGIRTTFDILEELPPSADAREGFGVLADHFPGGRVSPSFLVLRDPDGVTDAETFDAMRRVTERVSGIDGVAEVRSAPLPTGEPITFDTLGQAQALGLGPDALGPEGLDRIASEISSAGGLVITPELLRAVPALGDLLEFFVAPDAGLARVMVAFEDDPFSTRAISTLTAVEEAARAELRAAGSEAELHAGGATPFYADTQRIAAEDFRLIMAAVIAIVLAVFGLLLRSVVAPFYLLATVLLSFGATIGATVVVFQGILGADGITLWVPPFLFVMLVALGADYNIFLMSRVTEEVERTGDVRRGVRDGLELTGRVITSAGLILAGTFAVLLVAPMPNLRQVGFAITFGILLDTFVLRTLLVPSATVLLGRWAWWPRRPDERAGAEQPRVPQPIGGGSS